MFSLSVHLGLVRLLEVNCPCSASTDSFDCVGCDIVQADHAPEAGVAQGIFHGILVKHHGRIQEEVEEGLEDEIERHKEEDTQEQVRMPMTMDGNEDTQTRLEPHVTYEHISAMHLKTVRSVLRTTQCSRQCAL